MRWRQRLCFATISPLTIYGGTHFTSPGNTASAAKDIQKALQEGDLFRAHAFELACATALCRHRNGAACARLQYHPRHEYHRHQAADGSNEGVESGALLRHFCGRHGAGNAPQSTKSRSGRQFAKKTSIWPLHATMTWLRLVAKRVRAFLRNQDQKQSAPDEGSQ
jgi:hypothetical protein